MMKHEEIVEDQLGTLQDQVMNVERLLASIEEKLEKLLVAARAIEQHTR